MAEYVVTLKDEVSAPADAAKTSVDGLTSAFEGLGAALPDDQLKRTGSAVDGMSSKFDEGISATRGLSEAGGTLGEALNPVTLGIAAVAAAAVVGAAAIVGITVAVWDLTKAAIAFTQGRDRMTATFDALTEGAGTETVAALDALAGRLPFTTAKLAEWSKGLVAAGLRDAPVLQTALRAIAASTAIMGDEGGHAAETLIKKMAGLAQIGGAVKLDNKLVKQLQAAGLSAGDLAAELGTTPDKLKATALTAAQVGSAIEHALIGKGKGSLEAMGLEWDTIKSKLKEGLSSIFGDLGPDVSKFMGEVRSLFSEFDKGSATSGVLKGAATNAFSTLFDWAGKATRAVHIGMLEVELAGLRVATAVAPAVNAVRDLWDAIDGSGGVHEGLDTMGDFVELLFDGVEQLADIPSLLADLLDPSTSREAAIDFGHGFADGFVEIIGEAKQAGLDFMQGFADGMAEGVDSVIESAREMAGGAVDAVKAALDINSPSRVMLEIGRDGVAEGMARGHEAGAERVESSAGEMAGRASVGARASIGGGSSSSSKIEVNAVLHFYGYGKDQLDAVTEEAVQSLFERVALEQGLVSP